MSPCALAQLGARRGGPRDVARWWASYSRTRPQSLPTCADAPSAVEGCDVVSGPQARGRLDCWLSCARTELADLLMDVNSLRILSLLRSLCAELVEWASDTQDR